MNENVRNLVDQAIDTIPDDGDELVASIINQGVVTPFLVGLNQLNEDIGKRFDVLEAEYGDLDGLTQADLAERGTDEYDNFVNEAMTDMIAFVSYCIGIVEVLGDQGVLEIAAEDSEHAGSLRIHKR